MINIVDEEIEGFNTLLQPGLDDTPIVGFNYPGDNIEGKYSFGSFALAVDCKGDPGFPQCRFGRLLATQDLTIIQRMDPLQQGPGRLSGKTIRLEQLVVETICFIGRPTHVQHPNVLGPERTYTVSETVTGVQLGRAGCSRTSTETFNVCSPPPMNAPRKGTTSP